MEQPTVLEKLQILSALVREEGDRFILKRNRRGEWIWQVCARNGLQIGGSTEGYKGRAKCLANAWRMLTKYGP